MFSELKFEFVQTANENTSFSSDPTVQVLDCVHQRRRRAERHARPAASSSSTAASTSPSASTRCAPACCSRRASGTARSRPTPTAPTRSRASATSRPAWRRQYTPPGRRPAGELLAVPGRLVPPGRLPAEQEPAGEPGAAPGGADPRRRQRGTWRRAPPSPGRWPRPTSAAAGACSTTGSTAAPTSRRCGVDGTHQIDEIVLNPTYPLSGTGTGDGAAAEHHPGGRSSSTSRWSSRRRSASTRT